MPWAQRRQRAKCKHRATMASRERTVLIPLTLRWKESLILLVVDLLKFKTSDDICGHSPHRRCANGHACHTESNNILIGRDSVADRQPSAQIPDSLSLRKPEAVAPVRPHRALLGGDDQLVWPALLTC